MEYCEHADVKKLEALGFAACEAARGAGADQSETWLQSEREITVSVENTAVRGCEIKDNPGCCVRAFRRGGVGYARGMGLVEDAVIAAARDAAALSAAAEPDPDFDSLPGRTVYERIDGLFDPAVAALTAPGVLPWAGACIQAARAVRPDVTLKADITISSGAFAVANSLGLIAAYPYSYVSVEVFSIVREGDDVGSFYDFTRARRLCDLKPHAELARSATGRAVSFLGARPLASGDMPVVLGPLAAFSFLHSVVGAADAESVQRGRSFLAGKKDARIAAEQLEIVEDPLCPAGLYSSACDAEGTPHARRALIRNGALMGYLHNAVTASRGREPLTGNAERAGYMDSVGIGVTNLQVRPGSVKENDLIASIKKGLYVVMGSLSPNPVNGVVSGTVDYGFAIENGVLGRPVASVMIGGDVFELLNRIDAVSSDFREEPGNVMPALRIGKARVAGA